VFENAQASPVRPDLAEHRAAILLEMADYGVTPTMLNLIAAALDRGIPKELAVALAAKFEDRP
jgi:hypothetical protein